MQIAKKALLIILDGFGLRDDTENNAIRQANLPNWDYYTKNYAFGKIDASSLSVGLPEGQFGNSEVGHLNIGSGRVIRQDITRIDESITNKSFFTNRAFAKAVQMLKSGNVHIMGLLSDGGVHAQISHILALIKLANESSQVKNVWIHVFLDGRDTPPKSALNYVDKLNSYINELPKVKVATCSGRYYAMDRDKRYERTKLTYDAIMHGNAAVEKDSIVAIIHDSYLNGINDEFVKPSVITGYSGLEDGDSIIFANFRSDRAIQLTDALINSQFSNFPTKKISLSCFVTMTSYDPRFKVEVAFLPQIIKNTLGEHISNLGLRQLRIAETEKYPHITYFFNGGRKLANQNEDWLLVNSPRDVDTYDQKPEMSLPEVSAKLVQAIESERYDLLITNFANGDMVGHTGNLAAAIQAVEAIDSALHLVIPAMLKHGGEVLVIADHGNCENMFDKELNQPHTQHTTNVVPCLYIGRNANILPNGALKDVAPTILNILNLPVPSEMEGKSLIEFIG